MVLESAVATAVIGRDDSRPAGAEKKVSYLSTRSETTWLYAGSPSECLKVLRRAY